jgi:prepilin-type N-terminal cleavage/methylation domain-containing protein
MSHPRSVERLGAAGRARRRATRGGRALFTLVELLVVIAIVALLASLLLPGLQRARGQALHAACVSQLRQHGVAHAAYAAEFDGYFPDLGGTPFDDIYGRYISPELALQHFSAAGGAPTYFRDYVEITVGTPQTQKAKLLYCPAINWQKPGYPGYFIMDNPAGLRFDNDFPGGCAGYFFYVGRKMFQSTHSNADTRHRRHDPFEILVTDMLGGSDRDETGADYRRVNTWNYTAGWTLNPHESEECQPHLSHWGNAHQVLADGSVMTFRARDAVRSVAWRTINGTVFEWAGPANSRENGPYMRARPR